MQRTRQRARLRWRVVGDFGGAEGETFAVARGEVPELLKARQPRVRVEVPDRLGARESGTYELFFPRLRSFTLDAVVRGSPLLHELSALAVHASSQRILEGVQRLLGRERLYQAMVEAAEQTQPVAEPVVADASDDSLRQVLDALGTPQSDPRKSAARALDAFIQASRARPAPSQPSPRRSRPARPAHDVLAELVGQTACEVLQHPTVARLEQAWRGLKLLADQLPQDDSLCLEVSDVREGHALDALELCLQQPPLERPDALFITLPTPDLTWLRACAQLAERIQSVCIVEIDAAALGCSSIDELRRELDGEPGRVWRAACAYPSQRWLCGASNRVLLHNEPQAGRGERLCFGSAVWGVAALLTAAHVQHGRFARVLSPTTLLPAPTFWVPTKGRDAGTALPTAEFCSTRAQVELGAAGIAALGSTRRGDALLLGALPTLFVDEAAQPVPAQVVVGRMVRLAQALLPVLDPQAAVAEVERAFELATSGYLEPALGTDALQLGVNVVEQYERRAVHLHARVERSDGIPPFEVSFALPWPRQ